MSERELKFNPENETDIMGGQNYKEKTDSHYQGVLLLAEIHNYKIIPREAVYLRKKIGELIIHNESLTSEDSRNYNKVMIDFEAWYDMFIDLYGIDVVAVSRSGTANEEEIYDMVQRKYRPEQEML